MMPFGIAKAGGTTNDPFGFEAQFGYYTDIETGLQLLTHRYYDPGTGRFITRDPVDLKGGMNVYSYISGSPVNGVDPEGYYWAPTNSGGYSSLIPDTSSDPGMQPITSIGIPGAPSLPPGSDLNFEGRGHNCEKLGYLFGAIAGGVLQKGSAPGLAGTISKIGREVGKACDTLLQDLQHWYQDMCNTHNTQITPLPPGYPLYSQ